MYVLLNLAVGGNFDEGRVPQPGSPLAEFEVDYVRVHQVTDTK